MAQEPSPHDLQSVLRYEDDEEASPASWRRSSRTSAGLDELRRRVMRRACEVVHLTGHGMLTDQAPGWS
jgi:hypothetical protein